MVCCSDTPGLDQITNRLGKREIEWRWAAAREGFFDQADQSLKFTGYKPGQTRDGSFAVIGRDENDFSWSAGLLNPPGHHGVRGCAGAGGGV